VCTRVIIVPTAVFTGIRGGIFTVIGARVNVRIRQQLFDSLVRQEIGFFDTTKTVSAILLLYVYAASSTGICESV
jgi:ABC-type multidrug transport system fused ATPase/permease subunit